MNFRTMGCIAAIGLALATAQTALAQDKLKVATGQRGNWDTSVGEIGTKAGIFKKHGLELEILYTQGGGETQQAVISGSTEIGIAAGIMGVIGAYSKGAPVRIIGAETTGAGDLFAAGFLAGLSRDADFTTCGRLGALAAAEVIQHYGARPEASLRQLAEQEGLA